MDCYTSYQYWDHVKTADVQGDKLIMALFFWYPVKVTLMHATVAYTGQVTFYKPNNRVMFNWSPCKTSLELRTV